jgi:hypothetical protein
MVVLTESKFRPANSPGRLVVVVCIMLVIAFVHAFRVGTYFDGALFTLYYSYFSDVLLPFGMYFLLCIVNVPRINLSDWRIKAILIFAASTATEILQAFGIYALGTTFDPIDIVMFGIGVLLAVFVDKILFCRFLPFWGTPKERTIDR